MHPRLVPLVAELERQRAVLLDTVAGQSASVMDAKPDPDVWSPSEVVEHLAVVEGGVARLMSKRLERAKAAGLGPETSSEPIVTTRLDPILTAKIIAPELVVPTFGTPLADARTHLDAARIALMEMIAAADGYDVSSVTATHLIFGELNLYEWLVFLPLHELRHIRQIDRILQR